MSRPANEPVDILGIDCATAAADTGIARATLSPGDDRPQLNFLRAGTRGTPVSAVLAQLLSPGRRLLVGLDAPLGWPAPMAELLPRHAAGDAVGYGANELFRRHTDRVVRERIGKQPLDVGADRIARTAVAALELLAELRERTGRRIPVLTRGRAVPAWLAGDAAGDAASRVSAPGISAPGVSAADAVAAEAPDAVAAEVYPAGWIIARHGEPYRRGYRGDDAAARAVRARMLADLETDIDFGVDAEAAVTDVDLLDAILCVIAGVDVLRGLCPSPEDLRSPLEEVDREGWIWVPAVTPPTRRPES